MNGREPARVAVGDKVMVTNGRGGKEIRECTVTKVGPAWITVSGEYSYDNGLRLRRDKQTTGSGYSHDARFYTLEQWADWQAKARVTRYLIDAGLSVSSNSPWRGREAELVAILEGAQS